MITLLEWVGAAMVGIVLEKVVERWWTARKTQHSQAAAQVAYDKEHPYD